MAASPRFAVLRQEAEWPGARLSGLRADLDGTLRLLPLPATDPYNGSAGPVAPSGIAVDDAGDLYLTDTPGNRLIRDDRTCGTRTVAGGLTAGAPPAVAEFHDPTGVCVGPCGWLFVADTGAGRIVVHTRPGLTRRAVWVRGLRSPVAVAGDGDAALLAADPGRGQVLRLLPTGEPDEAVNARFARAPGRSPRAVAVGPDGQVYVADDEQPGVARFTRSGEPGGGPLAPTCRPTALALAGGRLYLADRLTRRVLLVDLATGEELGPVGGFRGVAASLAAAADGRVWIRPGPRPGLEVLLAEPGRSRAATGSLVSGPHDAGEETSWFRVAVDADADAGTSVTLETAFGDAAPGPWRAQAALDVLPAPSGRRLWLRVRLTRRDDAPEAATPRLRQVTAATADRGFADYLPEVYRSEDPDQLTRLLALAESALADLEDVVSRLSRNVDPEVAPREALGRLAGWQGFELPARASTPAAIRGVLRRVPDLTERRGTCSGLVDLVELHTGVRPLIIERFVDRGVWTLGRQSRLGADTMLPARDVGGFLVGDGRLRETGPEDPANMGAELFDAWAHRITVVVPGGAALTAADRRLIAALIDREKPAHVVCHLCFVGPRLRVGVQARLGIDAVVGEEGRGGLLGSARLDVDARSADRGGTAVTGDSHLGADARLG
jgi:phage tail-like protein